MSAEEFGLWMAFLDNEPIGPAASHSMQAELLSALANGPLQPPHGRKSYRALDFIDPQRWAPPVPAAEASPLDQFAQFAQGITFAPPHP